MVQFCERQFNTVVPGTGRHLHYLDDMATVQSKTWEGMILLVLAAKLPRELCEVHVVVLWMSNYLHDPRLQREKAHLCLPFSFNDS